VLDQWNNQSNYKDINGLDSNNTGEVMSDTLQICKDMITYCNLNLREFDVMISPGSSVSIEPAQDEGTDKQYGWILTLDLKIKNLNCTIPGDFDNVPVPTPCDCEAGMVSNSDDSYMTTVASGGNLELPDIDVTINGVPYATFPSVQDIDVTVSGGDCDSLPPTRSGQTVSYSANDDGDLQFGRDTSFFVLSWTNPFGNTNRFTDDLGTQIYANNIIIDWSTYDMANDGVSAFYMTIHGISTQSWTNWLANAPYTVNAFIDWEMFNIKQATSLINWSDATHLAYAPFNYLLTASARALYTSTGGYTPSLCMGLWLNNAIQVFGKTNIFGTVLTRQYTLAELGL
jgi:hypothetical protein